MSKKERRRRKVSEEDKQLAEYITKEAQKEDTPEYKAQIKRDRKRVIKAVVIIVLAFTLFIVTYVIVQKVGTKLVYKGEKEVEYIELEDEELAELELDDKAKLELMKATAVTLTKNRYLSLTPDFKRDVEREYLPYISKDLIGKYFYHDEDGENRYTTLEHTGVYAEEVTVLPYYVGVSVDNIYRDNPKKKVKEFNLGEEYIIDEDREKAEYEEDMGGYIVNEASGWRPVEYTKEGKRKEHTNMELENYYDFIGNDVEKIHYTIALTSELTLREVGTGTMIGTKFVDTFFGFNDNGHLVYFTEGELYD